MTPSGFNIGIILKIYFYLNILASSLSISVKNIKTPLIIHEPTTSPGWTLADIITAFFYCIV
jgi:hypothetical protein